jgi:spore germination protein
MRVKRKSIGLALVLLVGLFFPAAGLAEGLVYGAWLPYWEMDAALDEADRLSGQLDTYVAFAALFDSSDQIIVPSETHVILSVLKNPAFQKAAVYVSVVNDIEVVPGNYDNKSTALLRRLFQTPESKSKHIEQLMALVDEYKPDGLELDYENIEGDTDLWSSYIGLIEELWSICQREGVRLRVVVPWDAPLYTVLPEGPEYTVMCYNLFGFHSGPGPKADIDFLKNACKLYLNVPGTVRMAFATGGFDWTDGEITALTQEQITEQLKDAGVEPMRDPFSGAMKATYQESGTFHEVWYADGQTLALWRDTCIEYGYHSFDLFRLGGNDLEDWSNSLF